MDKTIVIKPGEELRLKILSTRTKKMQVILDFVEYLQASKDSIHPGVWKTIRILPSCDSLDGVLDKATAEDHVEITKRDFCLEFTTLFQQFVRQTFLEEYYQTGDGDENK